jgi:purine-binding chemotaxis protein CheW
VSEPTSRSNAKVDEILRARARELAKVPPAPSTDATLEIVQVELGGERFGIPNSFVREVGPVGRLTEVPCTPAFVAGIANLRGEIVSVFDLRPLFSLAVEPIGPDQKMVVVRAGAVEIGLLVDAIHGVRAIPAGDVQQGLPTIKGEQARYVRGVTAERLAVLDIQSILTDERLTVNERP